MKTASLSLLAAVGTLLPATPATAQPVVTIVKVAKPWYVPGFYLQRKFRETIPQYAAIKGLEQKYYTLAADGSHFGGIYLWSDRASAEAWFTPAWFQRVRELRGTEAKLEYFSAPALSRRRAAAASDTPYAALVLRSKETATDSTRPASADETWLRRYEVVSADGAQRGSITLWASEAAARAQLAAEGKRGATRLECFAVPVQTPGAAGDRIQP
ncbi:MAG: YdhR family protein [Verrucomicrobia bacterium]|nr:YdhR family protein [Verrucomicrobiota bacterium]